MVAPMREAAFVAGLIGVALIGAFCVRSLVGPFYRLPAFASEIMSGQPRAPRRVGLHVVGLAVVRGLDGAIYATGGLFLTFIGATLLFTTSGIGTPISLVVLAAGLFSVGLVLFRVIQVWLALRYGQAVLVEATQSDVGRARPYGSPWGDLTSGAAARGRYKDLETGEIGQYYMQQRWAVRLKAGMRMWVLRLNGRDVLYAPGSTP